MSIGASLEQIRQTYLKDAEWVDDKDGNSEFEVTAYNEDKIVGRMEYDWNGRVIEINLTYTPSDGDEKVTYGT